jgi:hypothetical protein
MKRLPSVCGACGKKGVTRTTPGAAEWFHVRCRYCKREKAYSRFNHDYPGIIRAAEALADVKGSGT